MLVTMRIGAMAADKEREIRGRVTKKKLRLKNEDRYDQLLSKLSAEESGLTRSGRVARPASGNVSFGRDYNNTDEPLAGAAAVCCFMIPEALMPKRRCEL
jgi:hypothetical protein